MEPVLKIVIRNIPRPRPGPNPTDRLQCHPPHLQSFPAPAAKGVSGYSHQTKLHFINLIQKKRILMEDLRDLCWAFSWYCQIFLNPRKAQEGLLLLFTAQFGIYRKALSWVLQRGWGQRKDWAHPSSTGVLVYLEAPGVGLWIFLQAFPRPLHGVWWDWSSHCCAEGLINDNFVVGMCCVWIKPTASCMPSVSMTLLLLLLSICFSFNTLLLWDSDVCRGLVYPSEAVPAASTWLLFCHF